MTILAKSDGTSLSAHTRHAVECMKYLAKSLVPCISDEELKVAVYGAILHDFGKAHPLFQESMKPGWRPPFGKVPHRHEISSILFLPLFPKHMWPQLTELVIAHHKSAHTSIVDAQGKGILDLINSFEHDAVFDRHVGDWPEWSGQAASILSEYDWPSRELSASEIREAFNFAVEHCEGLPSGRNTWRGLLMAADHLASALQEDSEEFVKEMFVVPDLAFYEQKASASSAELYPLAKVGAKSPRPHTLVIAPTGAGKTDYLLRRCMNRRVFYLLPFQASINAMFLRINSDLNSSGGKHVDIRHVHAASQIELEAGEDLRSAFDDELVLQKHPGASIKVMTPHQMAAIIFGLPGHEAAALDVSGQDVILDEIHVYTGQGQAMVLAIVKSLMRLGCRIHVGTATMPSRLTSELVKTLGGSENVCVTTLSRDEVASYDRHIVRKCAAEDEAKSFIKRGVEAGKRILFISNRVSAAQDRYVWAKRTFPNTPILLLHSRFKRGDRARQEARVVEFEQLAGPCIVCATQVIEVSLDISFDTLVTDCAPIDSLVQRFGRVNRKRLSANLRSLAEVLVIAPPDDQKAAKPYDLDVLNRTWKVLPNGEVLHEQTLQEMIDGVYPTIDLADISVHLVDTGDGFGLKQLCHLPRNRIIEALEIDSASLITMSDVEAYKSAKGTERLKLEIPVSSNLIRFNRDMYGQLDCGSRPFCCLDESYCTEQGLLLGKEQPVCIIL